MLLSNDICNVSHKNDGFDLGVFLGEVQTNVSAQEIANTLTSRTTARKLLHKIAAEVLTLARMNSSGVKTFFACDVANKRGA